MGWFLIIRSNTHSHTHTACQLAAQVKQKIVSTELALWQNNTFAFHKQKGKGNYMKLAPKEGNLYN